MQGADDQHGGTGGLEPRRPAADPAQLRVSDADRHAVAEVLRAAAGEGRLDLEELEERLEAAYAARTYADLVPLTSDLPAHGQAPQPAAAPVRRAPADLDTGPSWNVSFAMMSETRRSGSWQLGRTHTALALMGSVVLDLREAALPEDATIQASAVMGSVEVVVDPHTRVVVDGFALMGDFSEGRSKVEPSYDASSPVVRVRGLALMGSVSVRRKEAGRGPGRRALGRS